MSLISGNQADILSGCITKGTSQPYHPLSLVESKPGIRDSIHRLTFKHYTSVTG